MCRGRGKIRATLTTLLLIAQTSSALLQTNSTAVAPSGSDLASAIEACQASRVSFSEAYSSTLRPRVITVTRTIVSTSTYLPYQIFYGDADIYTTIDGIPHARGELSVTSTVQTSDLFVDQKLYPEVTTTRERVPFSSPFPSCSIGTGVCSSLWQIYLASLGLPTEIENATEPAITPVPSNRPRCSVGPVTPVCQPLPSPSCILSADRVDLYYWPANKGQSTADSSKIVTAVVDNITFTSPSVYLRFANLQALTSTDLDLRCSISSPLGATGTFGFPGGGARSPIAGGPLTNAIVSLHPTSLSSLIRDLGPGVNTASVVSEIAHGGSSYSYWINAIAGTGRNFVPPGSAATRFGGAFITSVVVRPVDFSDFDIPNAEAYYLNINTPSACNRFVHEAACATIFDDGYRAQLLVPEQVRALRPEWSTCFDPLYGVYDPPRALQEESTIEKPTVPFTGITADPTSSYTSVWKDPNGLTMPSDSAGRTLSRTSALPPNAPEAIGAVIATSRTSRTDSLGGTTVVSGSSPQGSSVQGSSLGGSSPEGGNQEGHSQPTTSTASISTFGTELVFTALLVIFWVA